MKGILFKPDMIQAIIEGRKTNTRRAEAALKGINREPDNWILGGWDNGYKAFVFYKKPAGTGKLIIKPRYQVGETVCIKEAHYRYGWWVRDGFTKSGNQKWRFKHAPSLQTDYIGGEDFRYSDNLPDDVKPNSYRGEGWYKRSPLFMWGWMARYFLTITNVRAGRLRIITLGDAIAKGFTSVEEFLEAFIKINHLEEDANPWDFAYTFKQEMIR